MPRPTRARLLASIWAGLRLRCPSCGRGRLFVRGFHDADACDVCGVAFEASRGEFTGALMFGQGFFFLVMLFGYFYLEFFTDLPRWVPIAYGLFAATVVPLVAYRHFKGAWIGVIHAFDGLPPARP